MNEEYNSDDVVNLNVEEANQIDYSGEVEEPKLPQDQHQELIQLEPAPETQLELAPDAAASTTGMTSLLSLT